MSSSAAYPHLAALSADSGAPNTHQQQQQQQVVSYPPTASYQVEQAPIGGVSRHCQRCREECLTSTEDIDGCAAYHVLEFAPCHHRYHMHCLSQANLFWNRCPQCHQDQVIGARRGAPFEWQCACCRQVAPQNVFLLALPKCGHVVHLHCIQQNMLRHFNGKQMTCPQCHGQVAVHDPSSAGDTEQVHHNGVLDTWKSHIGALAALEKQRVRAEAVSDSENDDESGDSGGEGIQAAAVKVRRVLKKTTKTLQRKFDETMEVSTAANQVRHERQWIDAQLHESVPLCDVVMGYEQQFTPRELDCDRCVILGYRAEDFLFRLDGETRRYTFQQYVESFADLSWHALLNKMHFKPYHLVRFTLDECQLLATHRDFAVGSDKLREFKFQFKEMVQARWSYVHFCLFRVTIGDLMRVGMTSVAEARQLALLMPDKNHWTALGWNNGMCGFFRIRRWTDLLPPPQTSSGGGFRF